MCRTVGHRWNSPQMLVDITNITTITNKLAVIANLSQFREKNVTKHSLFRPLHFLNFCPRNAGNTISEVSEMHNFSGENPPDPPKWKIKWKIVPTALFVSYSACCDLLLLVLLRHCHKGTYYGYTLTHAQTFGSVVNKTLTSHRCWTVVSSAEGIIQKLCDPLLSNRGQLQRSWDSKLRCLDDHHGRSIYEGGNGTWRNTKWETEIFLRR